MHKGCLEFRSQEHLGLNHSSWSFWTGEQRIELEAIPLKRDAMEIQRLRLIDHGAEW